MSNAASLARAVALDTVPTCPRCGTRTRFAGHRMTGRSIEECWTCGWSGPLRLDPQVHAQLLARAQWRPAEGSVAARLFALVPTDREQAQPTRALLEHFPRAEQRTARSALAYLVAHGIVRVDRAPSAIGAPHVGVRAVSRHWRPA